MVAASLALFAVGCARSPEMKLTPSGRACSQPQANAPGTITWYGPIDAADEKDHARACRSVGPSVVDPSPSVRLPALAPQDSLAVVAWNILIGGGDVPRFLQEMFGYSCHPESPGLSTGLSHFVLLVQEAYRRSEEVPEAPESFRAAPRIVPEVPPEGWPDIVEQARRCGLALFYLPSQRNGLQTIEGRREDKGNAILSTLPLRDLMAIELPFEGGRKVALGATVIGPGATRLRLVSVHLDVASTLYRSLTTANTGRLRQSTGLLEALALAETAGAPVRPCGEVPHPVATVAAGDFNTASAHESSLDQMLLCFPDSPPWDGKPTRASFPTDFIFFREAGDGRVGYVTGSERRIEDRYGSDHHARIAWFRFRG